MTHLASGGAAALLVVAAVLAWTVRSDDSAGADRARAARGEQLFLASGCGACHDGPGHADGRSLGPTLVDLGDRATAAYVRQSIVDPDAVVADTSGFSGPAASGSPMPALPVDDTEIDAIAAYLLADTSP